MNNKINIKMVNVWHFNCGLKENKNHMLARNKAYLGLADDSIDYARRAKKSGSTIKQLENFINKNEVGDYILLYECRVGYIAYGIFNGNITEPNSSEDKAPSWPANSIQKHFGVEKWIFIDNPTTKYFFRPTLCMIKKNKEEILNSIKIKIK